MERCAICGGASFVWHALRVDDGGPVRAYEVMCAFCFVWAESVRLAWWRRVHASELLDWPAPMVSSVAACVHEA